MDVFSYATHTSMYNFKLTDVIIESHTIRKYTEKKFGVNTKKMCVK